MSISKKEFGIADGKQVYVFTLDNGKGLKVEIINYGGIIKNIFYKNTDVVLGRDTLEEYFTNSGCYGALIGRNSNRIENAEFELNGKTYKLYQNNGRNNLHGGKTGFDKKVWDFEMSDGDEPALLLSLVSPDGDEGFPGEVKVIVTYTLKADNALEIHYEGITDQDTILNMTNHSYFNLNGHNSGTVDGHTLKMDCSFFTPNTDECMPYGEILSVEGTAFDLRKGKKLSEAFNSDSEQIKMFGGYDHNFVIDGMGMRKFAELTGDKTGIVMQAYTDLPGVQIYSGNAIDDTRVCKGGAVYPVHGGVCLETQLFPNAMRFPYFPSPVLKKDEKYDTVTKYKFI